MTAEDQEVCIIVYDKSKRNPRAATLEQALGITLEEYIETLRTIAKQLLVEEKKLSEIVENIMCRSDWDGNRKAFALILLGEMIEKLIQENKQWEEPR